MKILMGMAEVGGYFARLKQGFKELGLDVTLIDLENHPFEYGGDDVPNMLIKAAKICTEHQKRSQPIFGILWYLLKLILSAPILIWALIQYDVFVFSSNTSFLRLYDLPLLKLFGKNVIYVFVGSDVRPPYLSGRTVVLKASGSTIDSCIQKTLKMKRRIKKIERYADVLLSHPHYAQLQERPFVATPFVGVPFPCKSYGELISGSDSDETTVRILHSPSRPEIKGTDQIREAINRLKAKGYSAELVEVTSQPHHVVLQELAKCDFVVDQLYSDGLMPTFATEAASFGKAAVIGGYDLEALREMLPREVIPPVHICQPDAIEEAIEKLIVDKSYRLQLGRDAKAFVEANWSSKKIAEHFVQIIRGDIPSSWMYEPRSIVQFHGAGTSAERLQAFLRTYIERGGREALQLADKPSLEQKIMDFAFGVWRD